MPTTAIIQKRARKDVLLTYTVSAFGGLVLFTLVILITHLISQALPLALLPTLTQEETFYAPDDTRILAVGDVLEGQPLISTTLSCSLSFMAIDESSLQTYHGYPRPCSHAVQAISFMGQNYLADVSLGGQVRVVAVKGQPSTINSAPRVEPLAISPGRYDARTISFALPPQVWEGQQSWQIYLSESWAIMKVHTAEQTFVRWVNQRDPTQMYDQSFPPNVRVLPLGGTAQTLSVEGDKLKFHQVFNNRVSAEQLMSTPVWWDSLPKDRSLFIATRSNQLSRWVLANQDGQLRYLPTYTIDLPDQAVPLALTSHPSANALALLLDNQKLLLINRVTGEIVTEHELGFTADSLAWFGNRIYVYSGESLTILRVKYLSGITTWAALFQPQVYEGYTDEQAVWQTTSASDYQEAKYSLVPLLIGSLKASFLALLIAIPIALGAAVYSAYFATERLRHYIKPTIEMLEAIPSVLIGFIAAIWLAPLAEQFLFSVAFFIVTIPLVLVVIAIFQHRLTKSLPQWLGHGSALLFAFAGVLALGFVSVQWAPGWLFWLFDIDGFAALADGAQSPVGKTTIVVAIALGIAISPSIYSITEDAISGVPSHLKQASFALGATRLQTLRRVVLHVAMPGMLAAVMLGFGRAFGETMIVLMVTGNTPISSWSFLEGLRALTANLAIELPEADVDSTHYQILFFTACILFAFTFLVNTLAELLRQRLRRNVRYD